MNSTAEMVGIFLTWCIYSGIPKAIGFYGYDSIKLLDALENDQISAMALFNPSQFSVVQVDQLKNR